MRSSSLALLSRAGWTLGLSLSLLSPLAAQAPGPIAEAAAPLAAGRRAWSARRSVAAAREVMSKARYCALVTLGPDGQPQARLVDPLAPEADLSVWIATNPRTRKVDEIRAGRARDALLLRHVRAGVRDASRPGRARDGRRREGRRTGRTTGRRSTRDGPRGDDFVLIRARPVAARGGEPGARDRERPADLAADRRSTCRRARALARRSGEVGQVAVQRARGRELGVEGGGQHAPLAHQHRLAGVAAQHLDVGDRARGSAGRG